jgi:hypothetical protein
MDGPIDWPGLCITPFQCQRRPEPARSERSAVAGKFAQLVVDNEPQRLPGRDKPVAENRHNAFDFTAQPRALLPPRWADQSGQPAQEDGIEV